MFFNKYFVTIQVYWHINLNLCASVVFCNKSYIMLNNVFLYLCPIFYNGLLVDSKYLFVPLAAQQIMMSSSGVACRHITGGLVVTYS